MNPLFATLPTTVFEHMSHLARTHDAVNLGQGFPDHNGPDDVRAKAADAVMNGWNQYPSMMGLPELRSAFARHHKRFYGIDIDADTQTLVTSGATEALAASILGLVCPGDEVVLFEPMYDAYLPLVRLAGGVPRLVSLKPPHWRFTEADLAGAITPATKVIIINDPLNPAGSLWPAEDLDMLARFVLKTSAVVISDSVWEHVYFDDNRFTPLMGRESMMERVVHISSAGKIFSLTGWKIGMVAAAAPLLRVIAKTHQFLTFTTPPNLQTAVAYGLDKDDAYFAGMRAQLQASRDHLTGGLKRLGFDPLPCQGTYFLNVDLKAIGILDDDRSFAERLVIEGGVATIPVSAFYETGSVRSVLRFCFAKKTETLDAALNRLETFLGKRKG